jgi:hypothetical protein
MGIRRAGLLAAAGVAQHAGRQAGQAGDAVQDRRGDVDAAHALDRELPLLDSAQPLGIPLQAVRGRLLGQCLERGFDKLIADGVDAILTIDYDTVYTAQHVQTLMRLMLLQSEADAICPLQSARGWNRCWRRSRCRTARSPQAAALGFDSDLIKLKTGHFGLTLIRASSRSRTCRSRWFSVVPAKDGSWGEGHVDEDIYFWRQWAASGKTLYAANRVAVGHIEPMIKWPGRDLGTIHQRVADYWKDGLRRGSGNEGGRSWRAAW